MNDVADLRMLIGLAHRQVRTILAVALPIFLLSVAVLFSLTPRYTAQSLVLVDTSSKNLLDPNTAATSGLTDNSRVEGEVRIVRSDAVLLDVIRDGNLLSDPEFTPNGFMEPLLAVVGLKRTVSSGDKAIGAVLDSFRYAVRVRREGLTYLITVGVTSKDAEKAARLANLVTAVYIKKQVEAKVANTVSAGKILEHQVTAARDVLAQNERNLDLFVTSHGNLQAAGSLQQLRLADAQFGETASDARGPNYGRGVSSEIVTQYYALQQSAQVARTQYQNLLTRLQDFEAQASLQVADSRVVSAALAPIEPSYPRKGLVFAIVAILALGLGIGGALLREFFIGGFTSEDQVSAVLNIPLASVTPDQAGGEVEKPHGRGLSDTIMSAPLSLFSESLRRIRVSLDQTLLRNAGLLEPETETGVVVMVASALSGEGRSTLATSLARTYALAGKRTLLVDCDLRKPSIHRHVDREPTSAFVNLLRGEPDPGLANMVVTDHATNLSVILGARPAEFPTDELLMGPRVRKLLERARQHFDYIIVDTPPMEAAVDALYLARLSDAVLFVVQWATTPQKAARKAVTALRGHTRDAAPIIAVLNRQDQRKWFAVGGHYVLASA
ncbi:GNVR domain-containing protein [Rhizobium grahamii]|nr:GNVR domain-containing protein [Rhizobium grahamii]